MYSGHEISEVHVCALHELHITTLRPGVSSDDTSRNCHGGNMISGGHVDYTTCTTLISIVASPEPYQYGLYRQQAVTDDHLLDHYLFNTTGLLCYPASVTSPINHRRTSSMVDSGPSTIWVRSWTVEDTRHQCRRTRLGDGDGERAVCGVLSPLAFHRSRGCWRPT